MTIHRKLHNAFTLVELLVVIAIISVLAALLLPALESAISQARLIACGSTMRQVYLGDTYYQQDYKNWMPIIMGVAMRYPRCRQINAAYDLSYFHEVWPDDLRWCPTLAPYGDVLTNVPPIYSGDIRQGWGFARPAYNIGVVGYYDEAIDSTGQFLKSDRRRTATYNATTYMGFQGTEYKAILDDCFPVLTDIVMVHTGRYVVSHREGGGATKWAGEAAYPVGANSIWNDGHLEFHPFEGDWGGDPRPTILGQIERIGRFVRYEDTFWAKRGRKGSYGRNR